MTVVRPNSIAGINSITVQSGQALNIHDANGNLIRNITSSTGISTFASINVTQGSGDLVVGISTLFVDNSAGRIGVGTATPGNLLTVNGRTETQSITGHSGTNTDLQIASGHASSNLIFHIGEFGNTAAEKMRINTSSQILIGTTSDVSPDSYGSKLQIDSGNSAGSISIGRHTASASGPALLFHKSRSGSNAGGTIVLDNDTLGIINFYGADGGDRDSTAASIAAEVDGTPGSNDMPGRLVFSTTADGSASATEHLRIDKDGKITIGGGIQDQEAASFNSGANQLLITSNGATGLTIDSTSSTSSSIHFADGSTGSESYRGIIEYNNSNDYMSFATSGSHRLKLEDGDLTLTGAEGISANLYLIADEGDDNGDGWRIGSNQDDNDLTFANNDSGSYVDILTLIHKAGNTTTNLFLWGQGVTDGNEAMLTVKGTTTGGTDRHSQLLVAKHSGLTNLASAMRWQSDDGTTRYLYMDNSVQVRISGNYTDIGTTSGTIIGDQSSDIRLKDLVGDGSVPYGLSEINQLNPIRFKYKKTGGDPDRIQIGFSAQQVKPIIPEAVYDTGEEVEGEENILAMDYVNIIPALVNSIKELTAEVESLKTQVAELKS